MCIYLCIIEKLLIIYFSAYFIIDIALYLYSILNFKRKMKVESNNLNYSHHSISIIVPAFNEEVSLVDCVKMLLEIDYHDFEVIVVNDGSKDKTFQVMKTAFDLRKKSLPREFFKDKKN